MNGIQFYLRSDLPLAHGHTVYLDANWALTSISQTQFWRGYDLSHYGDGEVRSILSVDISNWTTAGNFNGKRALEAATREEIKNEVWAQLKAALNAPGRVLLDDGDLVDWFLDPDIQLPNPGTVTNAEPLLINHVGSLALRPEAHTEIGNLFLASDYVRTYTDLATMEAANEAARRATNAILAVSGVTAPPCGLWEFDVPKPMRDAQVLDQLRFRMGLPNLILSACSGRDRTGRLASRGGWLPRIFSEVLLAGTPGAAPVSGLSAAAGARSLSLAETFDWIGEGDCVLDSTGRVGAGRAETVPWLASKGVRFVKGAFGRRSDSGLGDY
jgi:hypothetical protein